MFSAFHKQTSVSLFAQDQGHCCSHNEQANRVSALFPHRSTSLLQRFLCFNQIVIALFTSPARGGIFALFSVLLFAMTRWWAVRAARISELQTVKVNAV